MTASSTNWARTFFTFWTGQALSLFGTQLVQFALIWWLTETTGSATVLATATLGPDPEVRGQAGEEDVPHVRSLQRRQILRGDLRAVNMHVDHGRRRRRGLWGE